MSTNKKKALLGFYLLLCTSTLFAQNQPQNQPQNHQPDSLRTSNTSVKLKQVIREQEDKLNQGATNLSADIREFFNNEKLKQEIKQEKSEVIASSQQLSSDIKNSLHILQSDINESLGKDNTSSLIHDSTVQSSPDSLKSKSDSPNSRFK